ncbi:PREDICTED: synaptonemal complex protein 1-like [Nelumbo nucifera]|uniref:Synaptonemal complex protein 1-like n=1 Tax=Nelumbo nucifera TaxID=4432 RepID=A0A1U8AN65_NELNU|nr:PREDICTED: synaptonemal complex protein 1-like [Nelumbo nucifera]
MMKKIGFSGIKSLDQFRSLSGSVSGSAKTVPIYSRSSSDSISSGNFSNLKLTAEKLVKEQASVKTDLEMANSKLKKTEEHIHELEEKLQNAINENAKLKVKQKEDAKLWTGLESKFSSTKVLCDQLTETLKHLAGRVQEAEQDKRFFEDKLSASSEAFDSLHLQMNDLSAKLESAEETIRNMEQELTEAKIEEEKRERTYRDENCKTTQLIKDKDALIERLEATLATDKLSIESLNSQLEEMRLELSSKQHEYNCLIANQENLEKEKNALQSNNEGLVKKLLTAGQDIKHLEHLVHVSQKELIELDKQSAAVANNIAQLNSAFDTWDKLVQEEKFLAAKHAQCRFDQLHDQFLHIAAEKDALKLEKEDLNNKVIDLQKVQEFMMVQHAEECRLAEEKVWKLESEVETLVSKKTELEILVTRSEEKIEKLTEMSSLSEIKTKDLLVKISKLESESQLLEENLQEKLQEKAEEMESLQNEIVKHVQHVGLLEKQVGQLQNSLDEKEELHLQHKDREKQLEDQKTEIQSVLAASESKLAEAKKQYDLMLESKQSELSKHLKEISQRNDQAINDIRKKYEAEKLEIVNLEKQKADRLIGEMERKCDQKVAESKEEAKQYLTHVQEEHVALINHIKQEHDKILLSLRAEHNEELKQVELKVENEMKEKTMLMRKEHEAQIRDLRHNHEDECRKLKEELELQKSKEERQRALLQLQWKVMDDNPQGDHEVNSMEKYSISSIKMEDAHDRKRSRHGPIISEYKAKDSSLLRATQTPMANLLKKVDKVTPGSILNIPKHSRKVTHHEYEVETSDRGRITKRRKSKSTVLFGGPMKHKTTDTPKTKSRKDVVKVIKGGPDSRPSAIGDLFTEGSLNPYADDPYAFD